MIKTRWLCFLCCLLPCGLWSQSSLHVFEAAEHQIGTATQGWFDCTNLWKSSQKKDTVFRNGRLYFFRAENPTDSVAAFVLKISGGNCWAYNGRNLYVANPDKKTIAQYAMGAGQSIRKFSEGRGEGRLVFYPFLTQAGRSAFPADFKTRAATEKYTENGRKMVRFTLCDSSKNDAKLRPTDPDWVQITRTCTFSLPEYNLLRMTEQVVFTQQPQYQEYRLTPIQALPKAASFETLFNLDSLVSAGYTLMLQGTERVVYQPLAVGAQLPVAVLQNPEGKSFSTDSLPGKIVLLEFWYKSCAPCRLLAPLMEQLNRDYSGQGLVVLGVNALDKNPDEIKTFVADQGIHYPVCLDISNALAQQCFVHAFPTLFLVDSKTRAILWVEKGYSPEMAGVLKSVVEKELKRE